MHIYLNNICQSTLKCCTTLHHVASSFKLFHHASESYTAKCCSIIENIAPKNTMLDKVAKSSTILQNVAPYYMFLKLYDTSSLK